VSGLAPFTADDLDWFAGMGAQGVASLRAATEGRAAKAAYEASAEFDQEMFTPADHAALSGTWSWFQKVVGPAIEAGPGGLIDDDLANVGPWGFDVGTIVAPVLLQHGKDDRMVPASHSEWLARHCPSAELRLYQGEGHISVLNHAPEALDWLANH
jgi:pimeloyl-ACP methyl ester carboxylesterase